jgi:4-amino-4-deoxy-L-arabinose transferase-like glycosyltransferase
MTRSLWVVAAALAIAGTAALYTHRLGDSPAYINLDEAHFANHAYSLATTGRDLNGNRLPLFISLEDPLGDRPVLAWGTTWYHPIGFYAIASFLTVAPLSEEVIRLPIALIGVLNIVLIYLVARRWLGDSVIGVVCAGLLAMTPAHFILSRMALDYLLPLPFTLGWLLALGHLRRAPATRTAIITGVVLGVGCYSYVSSWMMMPAYLAITAVVLWTDVRRTDLLRPLLLGFVAPLLALLPWIAFHPDMPGNILTQYQAGETRRSLITAIATGTDVAGALRTALGAYWSYFNPSFLLGAGGSSRLVSTGTIGVWPAGFAVLLIVAAVRLLRRTLSVSEAVIVCGLLLAPVPAALKGEPFAIQRAVSLLPFGVLLAAFALIGLRQRSLVERAVVLIALATVPVQFSGFVTDYFGDYRVRSAGALDPTAFRETAAALQELMTEAPAPAIALTAPLYDVSAKWRFYATANQRVEWLAKTRYFSGRLDEIAALPSGTLAVVETVSLTTHAGWQVAAAPRALFGEAPLTILRRQ